MVCCILFGLHNFKRNILYRSLALLHAVFGCFRGTGPGNQHEDSVQPRLHQDFAHSFLCATDSVRLVYGRLRSGAFLYLKSTRVYLRRDLRLVSHHYDFNGDRLCHTTVCFDKDGLNAQED